MKVYAMLCAGLVGSACMSCIIVAAWQPYLVSALSELHVFHVALLLSGDHALIEWVLSTVDVIVFLRIVYFTQRSIEKLCLKRGTKRYPNKSKSLE